MNEEKPGSPGSSSSGAKITNRTERENENGTTEKKTTNTHQLQHQADSPNGQSLLPEHPEQNEYTHTQTKNITMRK